MAVKSLSTLSIVINGRTLDYFWHNFLSQCLEKCNLLTKLSVTSNDGPFLKLETSTYMRVTGKQGLFYGLASTSSLKELIITINNITCTYSDWEEFLIKGLSVNNSITSLTITVSDYEYFSSRLCAGSLKSVLARNKSLTTLTLTLNNYSEGKWPGRPWRYWLRPEDPENTSLTELNLTVNICNEVSEDWLPRFCDCLIGKCSSLRTVRLQVNNRFSTSRSRIYDLSKLRLKYRSLSAFELSVTFYGE